MNLEYTTNSLLTKYKLNKYLKEIKFKIKNYCSILLSEV